MNSFSQTLTSSSWTEILNGGSMVSFDIVSAVDVELTFTETDATPANDADVIVVKSWPDSFDCVIEDMADGIQHVWARGDTEIRGVRE